MNSFFAPEDQLTPNVAELGQGLIFLWVPWFTHDGIKNLLVTPAGSSPPILPRLGLEFNGFKGITVTPGADSAGSPLSGWNVGADPLFYNRASKATSWVFLVYRNGTNDMCFMGKHDGNVDSGWSVGRNSGSTIGLNIVRATSNYRAGTSENLIQNAWNTVVVTYTGDMSSINNTTVWFNGDNKTISGSAGSGTTADDSADPMTIARYTVDQAATLDGSIALAAVFDRVLTPAEIKEFCANPWALFLGHDRDFYFGPTSSGVSGTLAVTLGNDTLAAVGTPVVSGSLARTLSDDTLSSSGTTTVVGSLARTLGDDTLAAAGSVGSAVSGTLDATLANDTLAASGITTIVGTLARTLGNDTLAGTGTTTVLGSLTRTLGDDTLSSSGSVGSAVSGSLAATLANDTLAASGTTTIVGTLIRTLQDDVLSANGTTTVLGTLAKTLGNDTLSATGSSGTPPVSSFAWRWLGLWLHKLGF